MSARRARALLLTPLATLPLALVACGGGGTVASSEVESKASEAISKEVGQTPKSIDCPSDLEAEVGAKETCVLTADDGTTYDMTAEITSVNEDDDTVEFQFQVADKPNN
jgi:hypothetical protein